MVYGEDDGKEVNDNDDNEEEEEEEMEKEEMEKEGEVIEEEKKEEVLDKDVCRYCHQRGHKERKCPVLHPELVKQPRMKEKKNISELAIRDKV